MCWYHCVCYVVVSYIVSQDVWWLLVVSGIVNIRMSVLIVEPYLAIPIQYSLNPLNLSSSHANLILKYSSWSISCYPSNLDFFWMLFGFNFSLVFISFHLLSLRRVESDDVGHWHIQVTEDGLNNEGMPPSLIMFILCFTKLHCILQPLYCMLFYPVASVSIDTLPWSACRLFTWHLSRTA